MKLCNPDAIRYPPRMLRPTRPLLMARLRASARVAAWVLLVFLLKVGMVAACTVEELQDSSSGATSTAPLATDTVVPAEASDPESPSSVLSHAAGGCLDCHCHHAAALPPVIVTLAGPPAMPRVGVPPIAMPVGVVRNELRPPIL